jgi:hypothetical protein
MKRQYFGLAELVIGPRFARARWLDPGKGGS